MGELCDGFSVNPVQEIIMHPVLGTSLTFGGTPLRIISYTPPYRMGIPSITSSESMKSALDLWEENVNGRSPLTSTRRESESSPREPRDVTDSLDDTIRQDSEEPGLHDGAN